MTMSLVFYSTMRYYMDAAPTCMILGMLGLWIGYRRVAPHGTGRVIYIVVALSLMAWTVAMGILMGFSSDVPRLRAANPALLTHLRLFFSTLLR